MFRVSREDRLPLLAVGRLTHGAAASLGLLCLLSALLCLTPDLAPAGVSSTPSRTFVTDGTVNAVVPTNRAIYIGGRFSSVGPRTGPGVGLDATTGKSTGLPEVAGGGRIVKAVVPDGSGGFYIGGNFSHVGGVPRTALAHILAGGRVDPRFDPGPPSGGRNRSVDALALSGKTLYVGGSFDSIGGRQRTNIAALDATTGRSTDWSPNASGPVDALRVSGDTVYAGGWFSSIGGQPRENIAAIDAGTGKATGWNPQASARSGYFPHTPPVTALAISGSTVYAAGKFDSIGGQPRSGIAALDATTGQATGWNPNPNYPVNALRVSGQAVYAGGIFTSIGGQRRNHIAALDVTSGQATPWNPDARAPYATGHVDALAVSGSIVYAAGDFRSIGGQPRTNLAAFDAVTGKATAWNPHTNGYAYAIARSGHTVYAGGAFNSVGDIRTRNGLAALDPTTGAPTSWNPGSVWGGNGVVEALAASGNTIYVGGDFSKIGSHPRPDIAAIDATTGKPRSWDPHPTVSPGAPAVWALAVSGDTVYAGGYFTAVGGKPRKSIAALDATTGDATNWNPNALGDGAYGIGTVGALAVSGKTVYAGGDFDSIGGQPRNGIAALDASTGKATGWNPNPPSVYDSIGALAVSGSTVYAGGSFTRIGGKARNALAALDATTGKATSWDPRASSPQPTYVNALAVSGHTVYAGGFFTSIGGQPRKDLAALDATTGQATPWNPSPVEPYGGVFQLVSDLAVGPDGSLWVGGSFTGFPTAAQSGIARFRP